MSHRRPDGEVAVSFGQHVELGNPLEVDELWIAREPELHHQEQLGTAAIDRCFVAVLGERRIGLLERRRPV